MGPSCLILRTLLSSIAATLATSSGDPGPRLQLRSSPAVHGPTLGVANKGSHVTIQRSGEALPKHHALRSVLQVGHDRDHMGRRHEGEPPATVNLTGQSYVAEVTLSGQKMPVLIDTGSADLWVAPDGFVCLNEQHEEAPRDTCNIPVYFQGTFSGEVVKGEYFSISYVNGQYLYGEYGLETVTFGGITVQDQQMALPSTGYFHAVSGDFSGIMGLGFPATTAARSGTDARAGFDSDDPIASYDPWFTSAVKQNLTRAVFSVALDLDGGGVLAIGGAADVPTTGEYVSTPMLMLDLNMDGRGADNFTYYTIIAEDYLIAGQSFASLSAARGPQDGAPREGSQPAHEGHVFPVIVDSGYSANILPPALAGALYGAFADPPRLVDFAGAGPLYAAPCATEQVPSFGIRIAGRVFEQSRAQVLAPGAGAEVGGTRYCALGSQPGTPRAGALGAAFLSGVVAVFDVGASEVRLAERARGPTAAQPAPGGAGGAHDAQGAASPTGGVAIPPASSGLATTNAGGRLLPLWGFRF